MRTGKSKHHVMLVGNMFLLGWVPPDTTSHWLLTGTGTFKYLPVPLIADGNLYSHAAAPTTARKTDASYAYAYTIFPPNFCKRNFYITTFALSTTADDFEDKHILHYFLSTGSWCNMLPLGRSHSIITSCWLPTGTSTCMYPPSSGNGNRYFRTLIPTVVRKSTHHLYMQFPNPIFAFVISLSLLLHSQLLHSKYHFLLAERCNTFLLGQVHPNTTSRRLARRTNILLYCTFPLIANGDR